MNRTKCKRPCKKKQKKSSRIFCKQGPIGRFFDRIMVTIMIWLQGNAVEKPQGTHFWNWVRLDKGLAQWMLKKDKMATVAGDPKACQRFWFPYPKFHMPRFGGWKQYAVLTPSFKEWREGETWFVGWIDEKGKCCVSRVPQKTSVRMLRGPGKSKFFALDRRHRQITVYASYFGEIGKARPQDAILPLH